MGETITFTADVGAVTLSGRHHASQGEAKAVVLIAGAMGVKQDYYAEFAQWLAAQGCAALSSDYRGMGESLPAGRSLRGFRADLFDWSRDIDAAIDALLARHPDAPLFVVGHSLGAQLPGLLRHRDRIAGLVSVAAGSGYWRDNAPQLKRIATATRMRRASCSASRPAMSAPDASATLASSGPSSSPRCGGGWSNCWRASGRARAAPRKIRVAGNRLLKGRHAVAAALQGKPSWGGPAFPWSDAWPTSNSTPRPACPATARPAR